MGHWSNSSQHSKLLWLLSIGTAVLFFALFTKRKMDHYVAEDPRFCQSCHDTRPGIAVWSSGSHARVACQACHVVDTDEIEDMLMIAVGVPNARHLKVDPAHIRCERCHLAPELEKMMDTPDHRAHRAPERVPCLGCHGSSIHGLLRPRDTCKSCHAEGPPQ